MNVLEDVFTTKYILFSVLLTILVVIYNLLTKNYDYWKIRNVPHEKPYPVVGNFTFLTRKSFWQYFYDVWNKYPVPYVGMYAGHQPALLIQNSELARNILIKDSAFFEDRSLYSGKSDPIGALNLFAVKNPVWSEMRHNLTPMFTPSRLRNLAELMNINSQELVKRVARNHVDKDETVNLKELFSRYASDTVGFTVFGLRTSALKDDDNPLWYIISNMLKRSYRRCLDTTLVFFMPAIAQLLKLKFFSTAATEFIQKMFVKVAELRKNSETKEKDLVGQLLKIKDDIVIPDDAGPEYADNLIIAQVASFIFGSVETSTTTLTYCLHELAHHQDVQQKLFTEIDEAVKQSGKNILGYDELVDLKYLNSCIQETLRKYPPVPNLDRMCKEDYKLNDQLTIEKGTPVYINVVGIHHDEKNYPEPHKWIPERFTGMAADSDNRECTYLPFGEGPRYCIGKRYGMIQMRIALAQMIHKFKIEVTTPYNMESEPYAAILSPKCGGAVKFVPRI